MSIVSYLVSYHYLHAQSCLNLGLWSSANLLSWPQSCAF